MAKKQEHPGALQALKREIKDKMPARLYFFFGEETFLLHYYLDQIKKLIIDELTESFNYHKFTEENFDLRDFADAVENLPMMSDGTMVWVDDVDIFKLAENDREKLVDVISDIPEYCTVVFTFETVEWKPDKRYKKLYEAISAGNIVDFAKQEQRDLIAWVTRHFASNKKRITPDLCAYLIDITGGTMTALIGEISKICAYSGADDIVREDIDAVTEPVLDAVVFQMTDYLSQGQYGPALIKLRQLLQMQEEPLMILGAIGAHFRKMGAAKILRDQGKSYTELVKLYRMSDYGAKKTYNAAMRFSSHFYSRSAELIMETDNCIKTSYDDPDRLLEVLLLRLSQEARNDKNP